MKKSIIMLLAAASLSLPATPAQASHFTCSPMTPLFQPGVGGIAVGTDTSVGSGWFGPCVALMQGNGVTVAYFSVKANVDGTEVLFGTCTLPTGDCPATIYHTGVRSTGSTESCGTGACYSGLALNVNNQDPDDPTLALSNRTGVVFVPGSGITQEPQTFICLVVECVNETKVFVGSFHLYAESSAPVATIPLCVQFGDFVTDCPTIL